MYADNELLIALQRKLQEIADKTADLDTRSELEEFIEVIVASIQ